MDISPINEPTAKILMAWGLPGAFMLIEAYIIYWLFGKLTDSQEQRIKEGLDVLSRYEAAVDKLHEAMTTMMTLMKEKKRGK